MEFNIVDFLAGLTAYQFDDRVYTRVATERGALGISDFRTLTREQIDLMKADLLLVAYEAPTTMASVSNSHNGFSQTIGSQTITDKESLYNTIYSIYKKYNDEKVTELEEAKGGITIIDESKYECY